jgi:hypothetical protein
MSVSVAGVVPGRPSSTSSYLPKHRHTSPCRRNRRRQHPEIAVADRTALRTLRRRGLAGVVVVVRRARRHVLFGPRSEPRPTAGWRRCWPTTCHLGPHRATQRRWTVAASRERSRFVADDEDRPPEAADGLGRRAGHCHHPPASPATIRRGPLTHCSVHHAQRFLRSCHSHLSIACVCSTHHAAQHVVCRRRVPLVRSNVVPTEVTIRRERADVAGEGNFSFRFTRARSTAGCARTPPTSAGGETSRAVQHLPVVGRPRS